MTEPWPPPPRGSGAFDASGYPSSPPIFPQESIGGPAAPSPGSGRTDASSGYPPPADEPTGINYVHPGRSPAPRRPSSRATTGDLSRLLLFAGPISLILYLLCGFLLGGWAWAWLFFLLPGALAAMNRRPQ